MSARRGDKAHPLRLFGGTRLVQSGTACQHPTRQSSGTRPTPVPLPCPGSRSGELVQALRASPPLSPTEASPRLARSSRAGPAPTARFPPRCLLPTAPASTAQSHPARAAPSPQRQQRSKHTHAAAGLQGPAAHPLRWGEAGKRGWQRRGRPGGTLAFLAGAHLSLCSINLDHRRPRVRSSALWHCCRRCAGSPPRGILSQVQAWGGEGV